MAEITTTKFICDRCKTCLGEKLSPAATSICVSADLLTRGDAPTSGLSRRSVSWHHLCGSCQREVRALFNPVSEVTF